MEQSIWNKCKKEVFNYLSVIAVLGLIYAFFTYIIPFFLPFFVGLLIAAVNVPFVRIIEKTLKLKRKIAVFVSMFLTISLLGIIVVFGLINIYNELIKLQSNLSIYYETAKQSVGIYYERVMLYYHNLPPNISSKVDENLQAIVKASNGALGSIISWMLGTISSIPRMIVFTVVSLLSAFFFSSDSRKIKLFIKKQLPKYMEKNIDGFRTDALKAFVGYIKAVLILMSITSLEVSVGLIILNLLGFQADYAILMGFIVGLSEAIPIFGTGIIMIPWILWNLFLGSMPMTIGLTIIFVVGLVLRQIMEPKIVGDKMGLHPLATLLGMYVGLEVFGFAGLFIGPFSLIILKSINKSGIVRVWKD